MVYGTIFYGKDLGWWFDVAATMGLHGIKDAKELEDKLNLPTVILKIPPDIMSNRAPIPPKPTIGRIVHYITKDGNELPAIIVALSNFTPERWVYLKAFVWGDRGEDISDFAVYNGENKKAVRTWHWPERQKE
jgi:hypothetical protein